MSWWHLPLCQGPFLSRGHSQAVHHGPAIAALLLPPLHLGQEVQEGLLGVWGVSVRRPPQVLEMPDHQVPLLQLEKQTSLM